MPLVKKMLVLLFLCLLPVNLQAEGSKPGIRIGVIVPLSGDMARHGIEIQRSMNLALTKANSKSLTYDYKIQFEDNQLNAAKSASAAQKLISIDHVDAIVTLWPPTANVVAPIAERAKVLHYTIVWDPAFAKQHRLALSHQAMVSSIAQSSLKLLHSLGKKNVAFFHLEETGFNLGASYVKNLAASEQISLIADESFSGEETDFNSLIDRVQSKKPDCFLIWSVMPSMDLLIRQIKRRDSTACITGYLDYADDASQIKDAYYISEMYSSVDFSALYKAEYKETPSSKGPNAYDITNLLIRAYESSPTVKLSPTEVKTFLTKVKKVAGAVGEFSIDENGNSTYLPVIRRVIGDERPLSEPPLTKEIK